MEGLQFDIYQMAIIAGTKINALVNALTPEQKNIYMKSINEQVEHLNSKLYNYLSKEQADSIIEQILES